MELTMIEWLKRLNHIQEWIKKTSKTTFFKSSNDSFNAYLAAIDFKENNQTVVVVTPNLYDAQ